MNVLAAAIALAIQTSAPQAPPLPPGEEAWSQPIRSGDRWARVRLHTDAGGRVERCSIVEGNIRNRETRFEICDAFRRSFRATPAVQDGVAVPGILEQTIVLPGQYSQRLAEQERRARRRAGQ